MREHPKGDALLACARRLLRDQVLPALPAERKHALLMALNAMSIAERQLANGDEPERVELGELQALLDDEQVTLAEANRRLAGLIRAGYGDPGQARRSALVEQLREQGLRRLAESNPKGAAESGAMSLLTLVRHGQASFAHDRYDQLSERGFAQARALGDWASATSTKWGPVRHGPRRRQADTAAGFALNGARTAGLRLDEGLDEFAEGEEILDAAAILFGRPMRGPEAPPRAEQLRCYEAAYQAWARGEAEIAGRESYRAFRLRVRRWLDELTTASDAAGGQRVVAVSSAGVISALVCDVLGLPDAQWTALVRVIGNASLTEVLYSDGRCGLRSFNGTGHLPRGLDSAI